MTLAEQLRKVTDRLRRAPRATEALSTENRPPRQLRLTAQLFEGGGMPTLRSGRAGVSPALSWTAVPPETKQLALLCEDPDAPASEPFVHWSAYRIPPTTKSLPSGVPPGPVADGYPNTEAFAQGRNSAGFDGFTGPEPPTEHGVRHLRVRLFALDTTLELAPGADRESLLRAMTGHVLASGTVEGTYEAAA